MQWPSGAASWESWLIPQAGLFFPLILAILCLVLGAAVVYMYWSNDLTLPSESRGGDKAAGALDNSAAAERQGLWSVWKAALLAMWRSPSMLLVGCIQTCFESSMYLFIFMWSPVLVNALPLRTSSHGQVDVQLQSVWHGLVFASFMVCAWCGSYLFSYGIGVARRSLESIGFVCMCSAAVAIGAVPFLPELYPRLVAFSLFELCVGVFWPYMSCMKEKYIEDEQLRATSMSLYRIPLNCIVVAVLINIRHLSETHLCGLAAAGMMIASIASFLLLQRWDAPLP